MYGTIPNSFLKNSVCKMYACNVEEISVLNVKKKNQPASPASLIDNDDDDADDNDDE